jgi:DNA-binding transcriptional LysR family regulator
MQTGSVTRAAELLSISQPAISKLLQSLEFDIGVTLFDRSRRRLTPTMEAARLHEHVDQFFKMANGVDGIANQLRSIGVGELRIASLPMLGIKFMPDLINRFCEAHKGLRVSLNVTGSRQVLTQIMSGQADIGFGHPSLGDEHITRESLAALPGVAILPHNHALATRDSLEPRDFENQPFISLGRENRIRHQIDGLFEKHNVTRQLDIETNYCDCACELVAGCSGVSIVDPFSASIARSRLVVKPMHPTINFAVDVLRPNSSPASLLVERFIRMARQRLSEVATSTHTVALSGALPSTTAVNRA